jgi:protein TonB
MKVDVFQVHQNFNTMRNNKSPKADLEKKRFFFFQLGLAVSLAVVLMAFEWTSYEMSERSGNTALYAETIEVEHAPVSFPKAPKVEHKVREVTTEFIIKKDPSKTGDEKKPADPTINFDMSIFDWGNMGDDDDDEPEIKTMIGAVVEIKPYFEECENILDRDAQALCSERKIIQWVKQHANYPRSMVETGIQGTVYVSFVIDEYGKVTKANVERGVHSKLDREAIKAVESLPQMIPGKQQGLPVRVIYNIPVSFTLK